MSAILKAEDSPLPVNAENPQLRRIGRFLMELGVQVSADVMTRLTPEEFRQIADAFANVEAIGAHGNDEAWRDFQSMKAKAETFGKLGSDYALHLIREALRSESHRLPVEAPVRENVLRIDQAAVRGTGAFRG